MAAPELTPEITIQTTTKPQSLETLKLISEKSLLTPIHMVACWMDEGKAYERQGNWYTKETLTVPARTRRNSIPIIVGYSIRESPSNPLENPKARTKRLIHIDLEMNKVKVWQYYRGVLKYVAPGEKTNKLLQGVISKFVKDIPPIQKY